MGEHRPVRRVVTGNDAEGRSVVLFDGPAPNTNPRPNGSCFNELWTIDRMPPNLSDTHDEGARERPLRHSPPPSGAHFRIVESRPVAQAIYNPDLARRNFEAMNADGLSQMPAQARESRQFPLHRTISVDYGIIFDGEFDQVLPDRDVRMLPGDIIVQLGHIHSWANQSPHNASIAFVMIGGVAPDTGTEK